MAVRNCKELGENLQKIMDRLMSNDNLVKLLYYTDKDPLSHDALTDEQKKSLIFEKLIKIIPRVTDKEVDNSVISIRVASGVQSTVNPEFKTVTISLEVFVPLTQWIIKNSNLRPFAILGAIQESLNNKKINGLGQMVGGDFTLEFITDEIACYEQTYSIVAYD